MIRLKTMKKNHIKETIESIYCRKYGRLAGGAIVGCFAGILVSVFRKILEKGSIYSDQITEHIRNGRGELLLGLFLLSVAFLVVGLVQRYVPLCSGSGIPQVKGELSGRIDQPWLKIIAGKFAGGFFALSSGLSLGREGPSVQLGAMVGKGYGRLTKCRPTEEKMFITCGAAAGLSGAFCAPLAGTVFALEELHKNFSTSVMVCTMASSIVSNFVSSFAFGMEPVFDLPATYVLHVHEYWRVLLLGLILGAFGVCYNRVTEMFQKFYEKISVVWIKTAIPFACAVLLIFLFKDATGGGHGLVRNLAVHDYAIIYLILLLMLKFVFSLICSTSGIPGGIFLPLLVLGAIVGALYGGLMEMTGLEPIYRVNFVILGMTGCFTAIVRSPVTGVILITEMTGNFTNFMPLTIVALIAFITAEMLGGKPIYDQLLARMLRGKEEVSSEAFRRKVLIESGVHVGSVMDGGKVRDMLLPEGCLIVSIQRGGREFVPHGSTELRGGDELILLCSEQFVGAVKEKLFEICETIEE